MKRERDGNRCNEKDKARGEGWQEKGMPREIDGRRKRWQEKGMARALGAPKVPKGYSQ